VPKSLVVVFARGGWRRWMRAAWLDADALDPAGMAGRMVGYRASLFRALKTIRALKARLQGTGA
jgi:hypothetical protein